MINFLYGTISVFNCEVAENCALCVITQGEVVISYQEEITTIRCVITQKSAVLSLQQFCRIQR